jgi:energy-converting hydrogenase Eha subunit E
MQTMAVTVPAGMQGGMPLQIQTPSGIMQVTIPNGLCAGQQFQITVPQPAYGQPMEGQAMGVPPQGQPIYQQQPGMMTQPPQMAQPTQMAMPAAMQMQVTVPPGVQPGQQIQVGTPSGPMLVQVPPGAMPGMAFVISVPPPPQMAAPMGMPVPPMAAPAAPIVQVPIGAAQVQQDMAMMGQMMGQMGIGAMGSMNQMMGAMGQMAAMVPPQMAQQAMAQGRIEVTLMIDDFVTGVFYNGVDLTGQANRGPGGCLVSIIGADYVPGAVLCIKGWDEQVGESAGLFLHCRSPAGEFILKPGDARCRVFAADGNGVLDPSSGPAGWMTNDFDDAHWRAPERNKVAKCWAHDLPRQLTEKGVRGDDGVWNEHRKHNFFRLRIDSHAPSHQPSQMPSIERVLNPPEEARQYSSVWDGDPRGQGHARSMLDSQQAWSAGQNRVGEWMVIDAGNVVRLIGIVVMTRGHSCTDQLVQMLRVEVSDNGVAWREVSAGLATGLNPNDSTRQAHLRLPTEVRARLVRLTVLAWHASISLRAGLLIAEEQQPSRLPSIERVLNPPEEAREYSSVWGGDARGQGHARSMLDSQQAWSAEQSRVGEWMVIDAGNVVRLIGIVVMTRGHSCTDQLVETLRVEVSDNGVAWREVSAGLATGLNPNDSTRQAHLRLPTEVRARLVRLTVLAWHAHISLRAGLLIAEEQQPSRLPSHPLSPPMGIPAMGAMTGSGVVAAAAMAGALGMAALGMAAVAGMAANSADSATQQAMAQQAMAQQAMAQHGVAGGSPVGHQPRGGKDLIMRMNATPHSSDKIKLIEEFFTGSWHLDDREFVAVFKALTHDSDMRRAAEIMSRNMRHNHCAALAGAMDASPHSSTKMGMIECMCPHITDFRNIHLVFKGLTFSSDIVSAAELFGRHCQGNLPAEALVEVLNCTPHSSDKMRIIEAMRYKVVGNKQCVIDHLTFSSDKDKARQLLF